MLTHEQIDKVSKLRIKNKSKDFSTVVGEAIDRYYDK